MNYSEMTTCDRIKFVQNQLRTAVQNHQVLYVRMLCCAKDPDIENMMRIMQELIMSLGRRQTELMYQFKQELREKYPDKESDHSALMAQFLNWHDRNEPCNNAPVVKEANGLASDVEKKAQIVKKKPAILARSGQKMTSLLKVNNNSNISSQPRKESERLKAAAAAAAKQPDSPTSFFNSAKKLQATMKLKNNKMKQDILSRRISVSDDKPGLSDAESSDPKLDTALAGYKLSPQDQAISVEDLSQEQYLECFGLVHKDKSRSMVVSQTKRKRRSAAGQSNFYNDYFQPRRPYNRKVLMSTPPDSAASSQELTIIEDSDKPSVPTSPEGSSCTEPLEENAPIPGSLVDSLKSVKETENDVENVDTKEDHVEDVENVDMKEDDAKDVENVDTKEDSVENVQNVDAKGDTVEDEKTIEEVMKKDGNTEEKDQGNEEKTEEKDEEGSESTKNEENENDIPSNAPLDDPDSSNDSASVSKPEDVESEDTQTEMEGIEEELPQEDPKMDEDNDSKLEVDSEGDSDSSSLSPKESELDVEGENSFSNLETDLSQTSERPQVPPKRDSTCGVCEEPIESQAEKCGACGAPSSCSESPSHISSIVGVDLGPSTLSSSDCSEMIKRYLDDSQVTTASLDSLNPLQEYRIRQILLSYLSTERNFKVLDKSNTAQELDNTTKADETSKIRTVGKEETSIIEIDSSDPICPASEGDDYLD